MPAENGFYACSVRTTASSKLMLNSKNGTAAQEGYRTMMTTFTFKMPTTAQGMMEQLTKWAKKLTAEERKEVRQALQKQLGIRQVN
jgi:hypothetical protein